MSAQGERNASAQRAQRNLIAADVARAAARQLKTDHAAPALAPARRGGARTRPGLVRRLAQDAEGRRG
jgi:hypothetical protein